MRREDGEGVICHVGCALWYRLWEQRVRGKYNGGNCQAIERVSIVASKVAVQWSERLAMKEVSHQRCVYSCENDTTDYLPEGRPGWEQKQISLLPTTRFVLWWVVSDFHETWGLQVGSPLDKVTDKLNEKVDAKCDKASNHDSCATIILHDLSEDYHYCRDDTIDQDLK